MSLKNYDTLLNHDNLDEEKKIVMKISNKNKKWFEFETQPVWINIIGITSFHIASIYFILTFPYLNQKVLFSWGLLILSLSGFGVTAGVHRLWTHRTYKAKLPLRIFLATIYTLAGMNNIYNWVRDHRIHHKYTETNADPHNSNRGFWFAHVGWLFMKKHSEVYKRGANIKMDDILADPVARFFDKYFLLLKILICFILPVVIPVYFFNQSLKYSIISQIFIRYPLALNFVWSVNSFAHIFGYRPYNRNIRAAENFGVNLVVLGEGWHNYHHVFPWDYRASEFSTLGKNPTTCLINFFAKIGWAYDLKEVPKESILKVLKETNENEMKKAFCEEGKKGGGGGGGIKTNDNIK